MCCCTVNFSCNLSGTARPGAQNIARGQAKPFAESRIFATNFRIRSWLIGSTHERLFSVMRLSEVMRFASKVAHYDNHWASCLVIGGNQLKPYLMENKPIQQRLSWRSPMMMYNHVPCILNTNQSCLPSNKGCTRWYLKCLQMKPKHLAPENETECSLRRQKVHWNRVFSGKTLMSNQIDYRLASKNKVRHSSGNYELKLELVFCSQEAK